MEFLAFTYLVALRTLYITYHFAGCEFYWGSD